jgi:transcription-repair coupling factor (superfamily II helicase)
MTEAELRVLAERWQLSRIHVEDEYAVLTYRSAKRIETLAKHHPRRVRVVDEKTAYVPLNDERKHPPGAVVAAELKSLLQVS